jgi:hypothetical protein
MGARLFSAPRPLCVKLPAFFQGLEDDLDRFVDPDLVEGDGDVRELAEC